MESSDANTYRSFKVLDSIIMKSIKDELDGLGEPDEEGASVEFVQTQPRPMYMSCRTYRTRRCCNEGLVLCVRRTLIMLTCSRAT